MDSGLRCGESVRILPMLPKHDKPVVFAVVLAMRDREKAKALYRSVDVPLKAIWWNGEGDPVGGFGAGHNVGQHIAMNTMLTKAANLGADYFLRLDEDCVPKTKNWLRKMVNFAEWHLREKKRPCIVGPQVHGLENPPKALGQIRLGRHRIDLMEIMGGICRLHPMSVVRYFRWDERLPMGFGEARQLSSFCMAHGIPMLRMADVHVWHGEGTKKMQEADPDWSYRHDMLQAVPYGL